MYTRGMQDLDALYEPQKAKSNPVMVLLLSILNRREPRDPSVQIGDSLFFHICSALNCKDRPIIPATMPPARNAAHPYAGLGRSRTLQRCLTTSSEVFGP